MYDLAVSIELNGKMIPAIEELIASLNGGVGSYSQIRECSLIVRESCGALLGVRSF